MSFGFLHGVWQGAWAHPLPTPEPGCLVQISWGGSMSPWRCCLPRVLLAVPFLRGHLFLIHFEFQLPVNSSDEEFSSWQVLLSVLELHLLPCLTGVGYHLAHTEQRMAWLRRDPKIYPVPSPCHRHGHPLFYQVAESPTQPGLVHL